MPSDHVSAVFVNEVFSRCIRWVFSECINDGAVVGIKKKQTVVCLYQAELL